MDSTKRKRREAAVREQGFLSSLPMLLSHISTLKRSRFKQSVCSQYSEQHLWGHYENQLWKPASQLCRNELTCHPARETNPKRRTPPKLSEARRAISSSLKSIPGSCFLVPNFRASLGLTVTIELYIKEEFSFSLWMKQNWPCAQKYKNSAEDVDFSLHAV